MAALGTQVTTVYPYAYAAYGITLAVPFRCPGLAAAPPGATPDVVVNLGAVPRELSSPVVRDARWDAAPGRFLLRGGPRAGRFLVEAGRVTLQRNPGAEEDVMGRCFTDEVLPAVLRHRGLLVLHANAVLTPEGVVVLAGQSGAGKSTTLAALIARGCAMLADDVTAVGLARDGYSEVLPGVARVRLTAAAAGGLGYDLPAASPQPRGRLKSALATDGQMADSAGRLRTIYVLAPHTGPGLRLRELAGVEKFEALQSCIYGPTMAEDHPALFPLVRAVTATARVYRLDRPAGRWTVPQVADIVLEGDSRGQVPVG
jgi:hypothetical protein